MSWFKRPESIWDMGPRFPVLDRQRQSSIPGLYMAGDVTGTPDIKAALNAGAEVARHLLAQDIQCRPLFSASTGEREVKAELWWGEPAPGGAVCSGDLVAEWERQLARVQLQTRLGETGTDIQKTDKFSGGTDRGGH